MYVAESIRDGFNITIAGDEKCGSWTSNHPLCLAIIKDANVTCEYFIGGGTSGTFDKIDLPLNRGGRSPDISNISFYGLFQ